MGIDNRFDDICYSKNYLTEVIARVDLLAPIEKLSKNIPKKMSDSIKVFFPIVETNNIVAQGLRISEGVLEKDVTKKYIEWTFWNKEKTKYLKLTQDTFFVVHKDYHKFEDLSEEFLGVANIFFDCFKDSQAKRLGLRYINNIKMDRGDPFDWSEYLNDKLLCLMSFHPDQSQLTRVFHNIDFKFDEFNLRFQFGIHNPDHPSPIKKKSFILDFDAFHNKVHGLEEIKENIGVFHDKIQSIFESCILESYRNHLDGK